MEGDRSALRFVTLLPTPWNVIGRRVGVLCDDDINGMNSDYYTTTVMTMATMSSDGVL